MNSLDSTEVSVHFDSLPVQASDMQADPKSACAHPTGASGWEVTLSQEMMAQQLHLRLVRLRS